MGGLSERTAVKFRRLMFLGAMQFLGQVALLGRPGSFEFLASLLATVPFA